MSKTTSHTLETTFEFDEEIESNIKLTYFYTPAVRERGPSYASGGEPREPASVEIVTLEVEGSQATNDQYDIAQKSDILFEEMTEYAENNL
jgi:hypothetical protein